MTTSAMHSRQTRTNATSNTSSELVESFVQMCDVGKRPLSLRFKLADAARGRPVRPLGAYPGVAEALALSGRSTFYRISRPLYVQLSRLRAICFGGKQVTMEVALTNAKKAEAAAVVSELNLALSCANPDTSVLATADQKIREEIIADEQLAEVIESRLYGEKK